MSLTCAQLDQLIPAAQTAQRLQSTYDRIAATSSNPYRLANLAAQCEVAQQVVATMLRTFVTSAPPPTFIDVWVDGSWCPSRPDIAGWGYCGTDGYSAAGHLYGSYPNQYAHISGEITAVLAAITHYVHTGYQYLTLHHDFDGLALFANGHSLPQTELTQLYCEEITAWRNCGIILEFRKIPSDANRAHTLAYNIIRRQ